MLQPRRDEQRPGRAGLGWARLAAGQGAGSRAGGSDMAAAGSAGCQRVADDFEVSCTALILNFSGCALDGLM